MEKLAAYFPPELKAFIAKMPKDPHDYLKRSVDEKRTKEWKGYRFDHPLFQAETTKYAYEELEMPQNAVYVVSFPKTGTNWSMEVVRQIMYGHDPMLDAAAKSLPLPLMCLEAATADKFKVMKHLPLPRNLFGSHLPEELFNVEKAKKCNSKFVVVLRNPKDQAVSWYHFTQNAGFDCLRERLSSDWSQFFSDFVQGKHPTISKEGEWYPDHILGWYKHKDDKDFLFIFFEDMKRNIQKEIRRIAHFLETDLSDERVASIAEVTSFGAMKKKASEKSNEGDKMRNAMNLMRKGQVGEWKSVFTVAQSELMDKLIAEKLEDTGIEFCYEL